MTNRIDGRRAVFLEKNEAVAQAKGRTARPGLLAEAEDVAIEPAMFAEAANPHGDGYLGDTIVSRRHQLNTIAIWIDHPSRFLEALSRDNQFAVTARCRLRQRLAMVVETYDRGC